MVIIHDYKQTNNKEDKALTAVPTFHEIKCYFLIIIKQLNEIEWKCYNQIN